MRPVVIQVRVRLSRDALFLVEREVVRAALDARAWNITHAAALLGICRQSMQRKMRKLRL